MTDVAVVIPSWDSQRAASLIWELVRREIRQRAEYIVVGCPAPADLHTNLRVLSTWIVPDTHLSPVEAMAIGWKYVSDESGIVCFLHDDMTITDDVRGWDRTIIDHFAAHPACGLAGFGGGVGFATDDIYRTPYDYRQLARLDFVSNMRDAEQHGRRVTEPCRVAALDGFSLIVTREFYERDAVISAKVTLSKGLGPWQIKGLWNACLSDGIHFHMYDAWLSCRAAELGYETWMLPVACHHEGGQTSVQRQADYAEVVARLGYSSPEDLYAKAHKVIYKRFSRVLPIRVPYKETRQ